MVWQINKIEYEMGGGGHSLPPSKQGGSTHNSHALYGLAQPLVQKSSSRWRSFSYRLSLISYLISLISYLLALILSYLKMALKCTNRWRQIAILGPKTGSGSCNTPFKSPTVWIQPPRIYFVPEHINYTLLLMVIVEGWGGYFCVKRHIYRYEYAHLL